MKKKILIPFNLESIIVHLVMLYDVFSHSRKFESGGLHCREEERSVGGGTRHFGGIPHKRCLDKTLLYRQSKFQPISLQHF